MLFGKIDYINLLPFHLFLKRSNLQNAFKKAVEYKKDIPSKINEKFKSRKIDAAFISSIKSDRKGVKTLPLGIVAKGEVKSVILRPGESKKDPASATSNILAKVLGLNGEVIIGDRALKIFLKDSNSYIDLAKNWKERYNLPFVFATFCVNRNFKFYKKISNNFIKNQIKIPQYILKKYAKEREIDVKQIRKYLELISYEINQKERRGLKLFLKRAKKVK